MSSLSRRAIRSRARWSRRRAALVGLAVVVLSGAGVRAASGAALEPSAARPTTSGAATATAAAAAGACSATWTTLVQSVGRVRSDRGTFVRLGSEHQACFDRITFEVDQVDPWVGAGYSSNGGSTALVVASSARLGKEPGVFGTGMATVPSVDYRGDTGTGSTAVVRTRAHLPFRVSTQPVTGGRTQIVVDVAHAG